MDTKGFYQVKVIPPIPGPQPSLGFWAWMTAAEANGYGDEFIDVYADFAGQMVHHWVELSRVVPNGQY